MGEDMTDGAAKLRSTWPRAVMLSLRSHTTRCTPHCPLCGHEPREWGDTDACVGCGWKPTHETKTQDNKGVTMDSSKFGTCEECCMSFELAELIVHRVCEKCQKENDVALMKKLRAEAEEVKAKRPNPWQRIGMFS